MDTNEGSGKADSKLSISDLLGLGKLAGPVGEAAGEALKALIVPTATLIGEGWAEGWRLRQLRKAAERAREIRGNCDEMASELRPAVLVPLLEAASLETDPTLQEMWASLLAEVVSRDNAQHPAFVAVLKQLGPHDARLLMHLWTIPEYRQGGRRGAFQKETVNVVPAQIYRLTVGNLDRLGLLSSSVANIGEPEDREIRLLTPFAMEFMRACVAGN